MLAATASLVNNRGVRHDKRREREGQERPGRTPWHEREGRIEEAAKCRRERVVRT
jgi:hypothetical protein